MSEPYAELLITSIVTLIILGVGSSLLAVWLMKGPKILDTLEVTKIIPLWFILILFIVALIHFW